MTNKNGFEIDHTPTAGAPESTNHDRPRLSRRAVIIGSISLALTGIGVNEYKDFEADYKAKHRPGSIYEDSIYDMDIESVGLRNGARLRSDPDIPSAFSDANILAVVEDRNDLGIRVDTPGGIYETTEDNNGWIGIPIENLENHFDPELFTVDADGIVWVSRQMLLPSH